MKKLILFVSLLLSVNILFAQEEKEEPETLLGVEIRSGGYGGPEIKFTPIQDDMGVLVGGRGGWIINSTFSIGGGGYGLVTSPKIKNYPDSRAEDSTVYLRCGWGGLFLEYINSSDKLIHFTVNMLIGGGGASYTDSWEGKGDSTYENSTFFVVEPGLSLEVNVLKSFRIAVGASYRVISGLNLSKTQNKDLGGITGNIIFKFGSF